MLCLFPHLQGDLFSLLLTFITSLASSDLLPSNYPFFLQQVQTRAQVTRKVTAGTRGHPCLRVGESRQGHRARAGTQGMALSPQSAAPSCRSLSIRNSRKINRSYRHSKLRTKYPEKGKDQTLFKIPEFEDHLSTNFQNLPSNTIGSHQYFK